MFLDFYQLSEQPFGVTPDPRFLYFSPSHREALASLSYGIDTGRGFLALIAKPGMGKTTLLFHLLERLRNSARTVFLFQTQCDSRELFRYLMADLGLDTSDQDVVRMHSQLNEVLLRETHAGKRVVLIIDEAQNLEDSVLETVRLLSDFETPRAKLLQIVLAGQPELADKLARPGLRQLRQRIATLSHLDPFTPAETNSYIDCRLLAAGYKGGSLFTTGARALIAERSGGIPRLINNLCFNALSLGFALKRKTIDAATVEEVVADLDVVPLVSEQHAPHEPVAPSSPAAPPLSYLPIAEGTAFGRVAFRAVALVALFFLLGSFSISFVAGKTDRTTSERASPPASAILLDHAFNSSNKEEGTDQALPEATAVLQGSLSTDPLPSLATGSNPLPPSVSEKDQSSVSLSYLGWYGGYLGRYGSKLAKQMRGDLSPDLKDSNRLEVGQRIRLPQNLEAAESGSGLPGSTSNLVPTLPPAQTVIRNRK